MKTALFVLGYASRNAVEEGAAISDQDLQAMTALSDGAGLDADVLLACEAPVTWGRKPGIRLIRAERERLLTEINSSAADFVVAFGPVAVAALWNSNKMKALKMREKVHTAPDVNKPVWVTFSLEQLAMKSGLRHAMHADLLRAVRGHSQVTWGEYVVQWEMHEELVRWHARQESSTSKIQNVGEGAGDNQEGSREVQRKKQSCTEEFQGKTVDGNDTSLRREVRLLWGDGSSVANSRSHIQRRLEGQKSREDRPQSATMAEAERVSTRKDTASLRQLSHSKDTQEAMPVCTVDLETAPGLDPFHPEARIRMAVISHRSRWAQVVPAGPASELPEWLVEVLRDPRILKTGSNIRFDIRWLRRFGYEVNNTICTQHIEHLLDENGGLHDLKSLALQYHDQLGDYAEEQRALVEKNGGDWAPIKDEDFALYAAGDGDAGITVHLAQEKKIRAAGLQRPYAAMREWFSTINDIEIAGACVDMDERARLREAYDEELGRLRAEIRGVLGPINPSSPVQLARALQSLVPDINLTPFFAKKEDEDKYSTRAAILRREARRHPVIGTVLQYRRRVALSNFIDQVGKYAVFHHGKWFVHTQLRGDIAATFRHSSSHPNLQNLPRVNAEEEQAGLNVKSMYISRFEGGEIGEWDESQLELREAGMISGDEAIAEAFASGVDVHSYLAGMMLGVAPETVTKEQRSTMKSTNFHVLYGGGARGLAQRLGVGLEVGQELIAIFDETFKGYRKWERAVRRQARAELAVYSRYGTPRRFIRPPSWKSPAGRRILRQAGNAPIQGGASWHTNLGLTKALRLMRDLNLRSILDLTVHDSGRVDIYPGEREAVHACMKEGMERPDTQKFGVDLTIPLVVDSKIGRNWGHMEEYNGPVG
jgi:DNA polymerase I-like protein with 3'-5' exonuclease and polymerase domains